ncbi:NACHT domain-containing protein [Bosea sp. RAF48]|uniref:NACHT domain-containing protein n=1 Tax=Bosea sp. RAF48 TaxID=3237480 RepID=UPI003F8EC135
MKGGDLSFDDAGAIDKVRASKAGHAFHEAWAARSALELLLPKTRLVSITLEGFDSIDEADLGTGAVEIADLVRYFDHSDVARASRVEVVQFKYSIASAALPARAADLAPTLIKFALTDAELQERHGAEHIERVVRYDFATNRPIHPNLLTALAGIIAGEQGDGDVAKQQAQLAKALEKYPHSPADLLRRLDLSGSRGSLSEADRTVGQILASWSETSDPEAELRLLKLRNLVRTKAGANNDGDKRINRVAVLAELKVAHEDQLYPTEDAFPPIGTLIARPIVDQAAAMVREHGLPLIIHGAGGMGKTVLMQSLAATLGRRDQVVIFDGFGAGRWRDPADGRHRSERTLVHLANLLAGHGLCDILLPISEPVSLLRAFRQRLTQAVATVRQASDEADVVLILDAIDHAAMAAEETQSTSFAHDLLRSLAVEPIPGVALVASCRTERRAQAVGDTEHRELEIPTFTREEARSLIVARDPKVTAAEIAALETRSGRNPRCLDTLLADGRPYDLQPTHEECATTPADVLDLLLRRRIDAARQDARKKGASDADIDLLLTGLALLPPPVPVEELAAAFGIVLAQVESFASDLAPLIERTPHGLMFRDEPTETLIRKLSAHDPTGRERIVAALFARQANSNYAARALPTLLTALQDVKQLITLAFDTRVPPGASKVSLRDIRLARITAALDLCAKMQRRDDLLRLLLCVAEARAILETAAIARPHVYDYTSYWSDDRDADISVVRAGINAALRGKPVTLFDLAPHEFISLVPPSIQRRGAAAFEKYLRKRLMDPHQSPGNPLNRRRKPKLEYKKRSGYQEALEHRIAPLISYAQVIAEMIRPPVGHTPQAIFKSALSRLALEVEQASNYPYRDGKSYRARTGFHALFLVADALGTIDSPAAALLAAWLPSAPGIFIPQLIAVIARLARHTDCHEAALALAAHAEQQILLDTDISSRVSSYGMLARAVWRVSPEDSAVYFRRTLDLADAIGSDDFDRTNHLLDLASHYSGPELGAAAGHTLARILELNQNEDSKFPWIDYAATMVPAAGLATLAMAARLDDRDKARLGLSLGPALTVLLRRGKLSGDLAACLFGLAAPIETWTWQTADFVKEVVSRLPAEHEEWLFGIILVEIDRNDQLSPPRSFIAQLLILAEERLPATSEARSRIAALARRRGAEEAPSHREAVSRTAVTFEIDLADPEAIDRAILQEVIDQSGRRWPQRTIVDLAQGADTPAKRLAFVRAVVGANTARLTDKLWALDDFLPGWSALSPSMTEALPSLAIDLARKHATELVSSASERWSAWRGLLNDFHGDRPSLVEAVVVTLGGTASEIGGDAWLLLAAKLAPDVGSIALAAGLERFLALTGATLPREVGDGPWHAQFFVDDDQASAAAGLIWARLGNRTAAMRWRAAHAVLRLAAVGRFDVIDRLIALYDRTSVLPFGDAKLPAYPMHAQLWLLIALARIAVDRPDQLARHRALFEKVALADDFPHPVMRAFAIDSLQAIAVVLEPEDRDSMIRRLSGVNQSPFPHAPGSGRSEGRYVPRPASAPRPDNAFHLDYEFNKYQTERLCHVFGCAGWEVEDRITRWVRRWDTEVGGMFDCPRGSNTDDDGWSSGSVPDVDRYGGYLGWHALMLSAGEMLQSRIVTGRDWSGDAWAHFLAEYRLSRPDGRWLAEATDLFPLDLPTGKDLPMPEVEASEQEDHALLQPMLGIVDGELVGSWLPVSGRWSLPNDTTVSLATVVASPSDAPAVLMTLLTDERFFRWLPDDTDEIARHFGSEGHTVREWIATVQNSERHFDRHDPYAARTSMQRTTPSEWICEQLSLTADDPIVRSWSNAGGAAFRAEAWGAAGGYGETSWDDSGERIRIERSRLLKLLAEKKLVLVGSLKLQRYHKEKSSARARLGDTSNFTHRSLVFSIDAAGHVKAPRRATQVSRNAVAALDDRTGRDFRERFLAIRPALRHRS